MYRKTFEFDNISVGNTGYELLNTSNYDMDSIFINESMSFWVEYNSNVKTIQPINYYGGGNDVHHTWVENGKLKTLRGTLLVCDFKITLEYTKTTD